MVILSLCSCGGDEQPPLDEMALRDALLADPAIIAHLSSAARQRLRGRFVSTRLRADSSTELPSQPNLPLLNQVAAMDAVRFAKGRDALLTGYWRAKANTVQADSLTAPVGAQPENPLPALIGDANSETILSE